MHAPRFIIVRLPGDDGSKPFAIAEYEGRAGDFPMYQVTEQTGSLNELVTEVEQGDAVEKNDDATE